MTREEHAKKTYRPYSGRSCGLCLYAIYGGDFGAIEFKSCAFGVSSSHRGICDEFRASDIAQAKADLRDGR